MRIPFYSKKSLLIESFQLDLPIEKKILPYLLFVFDMMNIPFYKL